jgi:TolB-like protein
LGFADGEVVMYRTRLLHLFGASLLSLPIAFASHAETLTAQNVPATGTAQATGGGYEATLKTVAARLVSQLELAHQKSATVLDFTDLQGQGTELGRFLAQELSDQLVAAAKTISLVDRANLQVLLRENKLSMDGLINPESSRKLGNMIGIDTVISGTVTPFGETMRLSVRAVAVETGKIVAAQSVTLPATNELTDLFTHGVSSTSSRPEETTSPDPRDRFRSDTLKLSGRSITVYQKCFNCVYIGSLYAAAVSVQVENRSGIGLGMGIAAHTLSAGACSSTPYGPPINGLVLPLTLCQQVPVVAPHMVRP